MLEKLVRFENEVNFLSENIFSSWKKPTPKSLSEGVVGLSSYRLIWEAVLKICKEFLRFLLIKDFFDLISYGTNSIDYLLEGKELYMVLSSFKAFCSKRLLTSIDSFEKFKP